MSAATQPTTRILKVTDKISILLDIDVYERAVKYKWRSQKHYVSAIIDGKTTTMGRFVMNLAQHDKGMVNRKTLSLPDKQGNILLDFTRANLVIEGRVDAATIIPFNPAPVVPASTPPPAPALTPPAPLRFVDITGTGMIINVDDIGMINCVDPDVVIIERRTMQFQQYQDPSGNKKALIGRDTICISTIHEGEEARMIRTWAKALTDPTGGALIDIAHRAQDELLAERSENESLRSQLAGTNTAIQRAYQAEADLEKLRTKLRGVGFDVDKLLAE